MGHRLVFLAPKKEQSILEIADLFCGGGGSGSGVLDGFEFLGESVSGTFVNHSPAAIRMHRDNHPEHRHVIDDLFTLEPCELYPTGTSLKFLFASPECTHHSIASGGTPKDPQSRAKADCVIKWIEQMRPESVLVENVKEFLSWGPLRRKKNKRGQPLWWLRAKGSSKTSPTPLFAKVPYETNDAYVERLGSAGCEMAMEPDPTKKGKFFKIWWEMIEKLGYVLEYRVLCSADYGDPTIRRRLFIQMVRKGSGRRIVWPEPTHTKPIDGKVPNGKRPWRVIEECIDWSIAGVSIFSREKELAPKTLRRIAIGTARYGFKDFIVPKDRGRISRPGDAYVRGIDEPASTFTTKSAEALIQIPSFVVKLTGQCHSSSIAEPVHTIRANGEHHALASIFHVNHGDSKPEDSARRVKALSEPLGTIACKNSHGISGPTDIRTFADRAQAENAQDRVERFVEMLRDAFAFEYPDMSVHLRAIELDGRWYPAIQTAHGLVAFEVTFRMLEPRELARAMGLSDDFKMSGTRASQIKAIGNMVSAGVARALTLAMQSQDPYAPARYWDMKEGTVHEVPAVA
jgi:DNA (cytosine-5)-methyltransferase 1